MSLPSMSTTNMITTSRNLPNIQLAHTNPATELTIVIPAKNEAKLIPRLLTSLINQDYSKMRNTRVLVANANSVSKEFDGRSTQELLQSFGLFLS